MGYEIYNISVKVVLVRTLRISLVVGNKIIYNTYVLIDRNKYLKDSASFHNEMCTIAHVFTDKL